MNKSDYRLLTAKEREIITWMLEHGPPGATNFIPQIEDITARSSCTCGCPSIQFNVPLESPCIELPMGFRIFCSGVSEDNKVGLMLTAGSGALSELEVYTFGGIDHPFSLPDISTLSEES